MNKSIITDPVFFLDGNYTEEDCTLIDSFFLKSEGSTYRAYINFCRCSDEFKSLDPEYFLSEYELEYFKFLIYERRIYSFLSGRFSAKKAVSALSGEWDLKKIVIKNGVFSQPVVVGEACSNIGVSLTHCDDLAAALAFSDILVLGIDIERVSRNISRGIEAELTMYEKELACKALCSYDVFLLMLWTMKESLSKCLKTGLTIPMNIFEVRASDYDKGYYLSTYTNFPQYNTATFFLDDYVCSVTYPRNTELIIDTGKFISNFDNYCKG